MDIPFDQPFTGYGAPGAAQAAATGNASYADEVRARAAKLPSYGAQMGAPPPAAVAGDAASAGRFFNRPIQVPSWLKTAGGFGSKALRFGGVAGTAASLVMPMAQGLKSASEWAANKYATGGASDLSPGPALQGAPAAAPGPGAVAPAAAQPEFGVETPQGFGAVSSYAPAQPVATPNNAVVPSPGTGFIQNQQTGAVTNFNAPPPAAAAMPDYSGNPAAAFFQAGAHLKNIANDNAQRLASSKLLLDTITKGAEANKNNAVADRNNFGVQAALEHLKSNPGDYAGAGAVAAGRVVPNKSVFLPTMSADKVDVGNTRTGTVQRVTVPAKVNESDIQQTMKANKMTREQVLQRLKDEGRM